jgi:hypothetical protein
MTQDEIVKSLKEIVAQDIGYTTWTISTPHLVSLVNKAIDIEREACAKIADEWAVGWPHPSQVIAERIRERT